MFDLLHLGLGQGRWPMHCTPLGLWHDLRRGGGLRRRGWCVERPGGWVGVDVCLSRPWGQAWVPGREVMRPCRCPGSRLHIYRTPTDSLASVAGVCGCGPALSPGNVWSCTLEAHGLQIQGRRLCCGLRDRDVGQGEGVQGSGSLWGLQECPCHPWLWWLCRAGVFSL